MAQMTGGQAIVQSLVEYGVDTVFCLPGAQLDPLFDAFYEARDKIRLIHTRHEQGAAYMALGYAKTTGKVGVCNVVPGPGALNAGAGLLTAMGQNMPVLCICGQIPSPFIEKGFGFLHEIPDQMGTMAAATKWQGRADTAGDTPGLMRDAFRAMMTGRRGPAFLEMAPDVMAKPGEVEILPGETSFDVMEPDPDLVEKAAALLGNAENPVIFVGGGIWGAEASLKALADTLEAPVVMTEAGLGAVDWRDPKAQNMIAGQELWKKADVVLAVGTRMFTPKFNWKFDKPATLIRIDADAAQAARPWEADLTLNAEAVPTMAALADRAGRHNRSRESRDDEYATLKQSVVDRLVEGLPESSAFGGAIRRALPEDGIACFGVTQMGFYSWWGFPAYSPRSIIEPGLQGTLGYGFPTALGAKVAFPDREVVSVTGDGGFMFCASELATAAHHGINTVTVVMNDSAFGNVKRNQKTGYGERYIASDLTNPDFMKLADAYGIWGRRVDNAADLETAITDAFAAKSPALIEVTVGEFSPWQPFHQL
jgi:acetolactate synthase-1/2/3 large subunit